MSQEIGWFDLRNAGELSSRLVNDLDTVKDGIGEKVPDFVSLITKVTGCLILALAKGWKLTLVYMGISPLIIITFNITLRIVVKYTAEEMQASATASAVAQEVLMSIRTVTAFGGQKKEEERFSKNLLYGKIIGIKKAFYTGLCQAFFSFITFSNFALIFWYAPFLVRTECKSYSAGSAILIILACMSATFSISNLFSNIQSFAEASASARYVFDIIERTSNINAFNDNYGDKPDLVVGDIEFQNVQFAFPARKDMPVLNKVSMKIPSGKTVALVGESGCGKSTTIQLIQRFYDVDEGQILLDGHDLRSLNVAWLRNNIGIVAQEPVLFTGTIEDNIRFGKTDATDEEVVE
ncbi:unnamed protein product [Didymodactylos carnosus]|nr:unnamed protein product [Didymodactylos carnosus]CAF4460402.1 unnamed protein product [Didymodactylos carnosus]